jgi:hypothetical protein
MQYSELYLEWVKQAELKPLTNTQAKFAQFLLDHKEDVNKIGDLRTIFESVTSFLKK